jgi:hypothetical protein
MRLHAPEQGLLRKRASHCAEASGVNPSRAGRAAHTLLRLQRAAGNQAVGRLLRLQAKLAVGARGDAYEQEADRVAERVTNMHEPRAERDCSCGGGCASCTAEQTGHGPLQVARAEAAEADGAEAPQSVGEVLGSPGAPLDAETRAFFEPRFGYDFGGVRVHTDGAAAESARELNARAYTVGSHIAFMRGGYEPDSAEGRRLLAHELTHVVQQGGGEAAPSVQLDRYCPDGAVDDAAVQRHIDSALAFARRPRGGGIDLAVAFARLRSSRENHCCDLNLAAAEHYMWARSEVASGAWSFFMIAATIAYDFVKFARLAPRTGDCPITRASFAQIRWATQGALDGEMDYYSSP